MSTTNIATTTPISSHDDLLHAIINAPIVPTVFPINSQLLERYATVLAQESFPAIEVLARPLDEAMAILEPVLNNPARHSLKWGVGTIKTRAAAQQLVKLKPDFLVSPAFSRHVLDVAAEAGIPYIPGVHTFQDVQNVLDAFDDLGLKASVLKLCPVYGLDENYIAALCGCFPGIHFCPTGEITMDNYLHWKKMPGIIAPMGSLFVPSDIIESQEPDAIQKRLKLLRRMSESTRQ